MRKAVRGHSALPERPGSRLAAKDGFFLRNRREILTESGLRGKLSKEKE